MPFLRVANSHGTTRESGILPALLLMIPGVDFGVLQKMIMATIEKLVAR